MSRSRSAREPDWADQTVEKAKREEPKVVEIIAKFVSTVLSWLDMSWRLLVGVGFVIIVTGLGLFIAGILRETDSDSIRSAYQPERWYCSYEEGRTIHRIVVDETDLSGEAPMLKVRVDEKERYIQRASLTNCTPAPGPQ